MNESNRFNKNCSIQQNHITVLNSGVTNPFYNIFLLQGDGKVRIDFADYSFDGNTVLFSTPYQHIQFTAQAPMSVRTLQFHGDFYCIEYHKKEVACNGLLFNNIYLEPFIQVTSEQFQELQELFDRLSLELNFSDSYSEAVARAYLQLVLAISSKVKTSSIVSRESDQNRHPVMQFKSLLEQHFYTERQPSFYADQLGISTNTFSKKCREHFSRTPSELIHERVILEAKKLIHLSYQSIKQIAAKLNFTDEHYFSRYFKKHTGVSPTTFREKVGISIAADTSS
jgi:AraC family transcriptional regulator, transcriptional activator of pobA